MDLVLARSPLLLLVVIVLAAIFAWWSYGRMAPQPDPGNRLVLGGLRFGAFAILLALLFEPIVQRITTHDEEPLVAVLLDGTRSLAPADTGGAGADDLRRVLAALPDLSAETRLFRFAGDVRPFEDDSLRFDGARTDISNALEEVRRRFDRRNLRAVVLVSDGRYNTGRNPLFLAERYPVPIYTITVGDTLEPRDVRIADAVTNEIAYTGVELPVRVSLHAQGFGGERAVVTLSESGRTLAQEPVVIPEDGLEASVELLFTPEEEGLRRYTASVTRFEGEATHLNNSAGLVVRVMSARRSVLLLAAAPGPDLSAIRQELEKDPDLEITTRTPRGPDLYYEGAFPERLDEFDILVLAGFPGRATSAADARAVARAASAGRPLLFVLTRQTDLEKLASAFDDALPARPEVVRAAFHEAHLRTSTPGATHPVLRIPGVPVGSLDRLPPVLANESRWTLSPDARALATARVRGVDLDDPLIAVRRRANARSAAVLAAATWRWRNLPPDLDHLAGFYPGMMRNLVTWLTAHEDDRPVRVRPVQGLFDTTEPARFTGQVYDEALQPLSDADVQLSIAAPDGTDLPFTMRPLGNGRFELETGLLGEGEYTYAARAERDGVYVGSDRGAFAVGALDLELRRLTADPALMRELAVRSGGEAFFPDETPALATSLQERLVARPVSTTREFELWRLAPLLALLVGLLTIEWTLRKRAGMV